MKWWWSTGVVVEYNGSALDGGAGKVAVQDCLGAGK